MEILNKIQAAEALLSANKALFLSDSHLTSLLFRLESAITASHKAMVMAGIVEICRRCDEERGGSCCGDGMERHYDQWLILTNLLLGVDVSHDRQDPRACFFLGRKGCILRARHTICINYLCSDITKSVDPDLVSQLKIREGEELSLLFHTIEHLKRIVRERGGQV